MQYSRIWGYDALGRRVLARRRADSLCTGGTSFCASTIERFVWDGDQVLYELRAPGGDNLSGALDATPPYIGADAKQFGRVAYTHGPGLDAPLDLIRMDYNSAEYTVLPHTNWRGEYGAGTDTVGAPYGFDFQWPADFRRAFHNDDGFGDRGLPEWFGSLIQGKRDQTGLMYMRNRYYDPNSGRFTQEDPIGLAGGLNLYGFASGDPVNFGDPFGLCPKYAGGDGKTETAGDCPREVLDAWAEKHVQLGKGASWDDVDPTLRDAVTKGSIDLNADLYVSATRNGVHAKGSAHYEGNAVDVSRVNDVRIAAMTAEGREGEAARLGYEIFKYIPGNRRREFITPAFGLRFHRPRWSADRIRTLIDEHSDHVHISILP